MNKVVGIDLGTTNSVVAITEGANPLLLQIQKVSEQPLRLLPIQKNKTY